MKCIVRAALSGAFLLVLRAAGADMSYSPWVHEIVQKGNENEITVQIFEETTWVNDGGESLPGTDAKYTLTRMSESVTTDVFKDRQLDPTAAQEVMSFGC